MIVAGNANITKKAAEQIAQAALDYADERGYCDTVEEFLTHLGFPVPTQEKTVVITVKVKAGRDYSGYDLESALNDVSVQGWAGGDVVILSQESEHID